MPSTRTSRVGAQAVLLSLPLLLSTSACVLDDGWFYQTVFPCDHHDQGDVCGKAADGGPMFCLDSSPFNGHDFCVEACDPAVPPADSRLTCLSSGALVQKCNPDLTVKGAVGCPKALSCYRTDLLLNDGVCLKMDLCAQDTDCKDTARPVCAATILKNLSKQSWKFDHLQCVQPTCKSSGTDCPIGFACPADFFETGMEIPDVCSPVCDGAGHCPPNMNCARNKVSAPGAPDICVPGFPGTRCAADQDCVIGTCVQTTVGFGVCLFTGADECASDAACGEFNVLGFQYACADTMSGRHCVATSPFHGSNCQYDTDCAPDLHCYFASPFELGPTHGECRLACGAGGECPTRSGIPHTCLANGDGGCYPGEFGLPCHASSECISTLSCLAVTQDDRAVVQSDGICTIACQSDQDCRTNKWINNGGFCEGGVCRLSGSPGVACTRGAECFHDACGRAMDGVMRCLN